jgi:hypothetical protein
LKLFESVRWTRVILWALIGFLISMAIASLWPRRFVSEAIVRFRFTWETMRLHPELETQDFSPYLAHFQEIAFSEQNLLKIAKHNNLYPNDTDSARVRQIRRNFVMSNVKISGIKQGDFICCWTLSFGSSDAAVARRVNIDLVGELLVSPFKAGLLRSGCPGPGDCGGNGFEQVDPPSLPIHGTPPLWAFGAVGIGTGLALGATFGLLRSV